VRGQLERAAERTAPATTPSLSRKKRIGFTVTALIMAVSASAVMGEILVRLRGHTPWTKNGVDGDRPVYHEADEILGWRHKPGTYVIANYTPGAPPIEMTLLEDGGRATGFDGTPGRPIVALMGCSVTHGMGLTDRDTYPWKLQERHPEVEIRNYGTCGYSTYQSLMALEHLFADPERPGLVLLGFIDHHEDRNVAEPHFLRGLTRLSRRHTGRGQVALPYCSLGPGGSLVKHPPLRYPAWPLREYSALAAFLQMRYMDLATRWRIAQKRAVTERLLVDMDGLCRRNGVDFAVIMLLGNDEAKSHYKAFCETVGIAFSDCAYDLTHERRIRGEGHPNAVLNDLWATRIDEQVGTKLRSLSDRPRVVRAGLDRGESIDFLDDTR
jgi:hypothetical protein